jgi:hypothetical protein
MRQDGRYYTMNHGWQTYRGTTPSRSGLAIETAGAVLECSEV